MLLKTAKCRGTAIALAAITALMSIGIASTVSHASESAGVTEIASLSQITDSGGNYKLTGSVTINASSWIPIASFSGTFDGGGNTITWTGSASITESKYGIFAESLGTIRNFKVEGSLTVTGSNNDYVSTVVGYNTGTIENVTNNAVLTTTGIYNVGGIAGFNDEGTISKCKNIAKIENTNKTKTGGIVGENAGAVVSCSNTGIVTSSYGSKDGIGGIAGRNGNNNTATESGAIVNCYNRGNISDSNGKWVGGITGFQNSLSYTKNCYSTGTVAGVGYKNAIVGNNEGTAEHNYAISAAQSGNSGSDAEKGTLVSLASELLTNLQGFDTASASVWVADTYNTNDGYPVINGASSYSPNEVENLTNDYAVVYLKSTGSDAKANNVVPGGTTATAVKTLSRAVAVAKASSNSNVYISVLDTVDIDGGSADGIAISQSGVRVVWGGSSTDDIMFNVIGTKSARIGGLVINGNGVGTVFDVADNALLSLNNNVTVSNCGTAVNVAGSGSVTVNRSNISATTNSIKLASSASKCTMSVASGQNITLSGNVYLGTGATITMGANPSTMLVNPITVACQSTASTITVAVPETGITFTLSDCAKISSDNSDYETALDNSGNIILK